jgi:mono/diheme cytochrome c family protein
MPCMQMKELEASCARYDERRSKTVVAGSERRQGRSAKRQIGQAQMAYVMQQHAKNCSECHRDRAKG